MSRFVWRCHKSLNKKCITPPPVVCECITLTNLIVPVRISHAFILYNFFNLGINIRSHHCQHNTWLIFRLVVIMQTLPTFKLGRCWWLSDLVNIWYVCPHSIMAVITQHICCAFWETCKCWPFLYFFFFFNYIYKQKQKKSRQTKCSYLAFISYCCFWSTSPLLFIFYKSFPTSGI